MGLYILYDYVYVIEFSYTDSEAITITKQIIIFYLLGIVKISEL
jgi:hypothetical protein